jgi:hypothetical protein
LERIETADAVPINHRVISYLLVTTISSFAEPLWVGVGYGGRRISSRDGQTWENDQRWSDEAKDDDNVLFNIAYGRPEGAKEGIFIAVGGGAKIGHILSTTDGAKWTELPGRKGRIATIVFGNGRFVAGHDAELLYSTDGATFEKGERLDWKGSVHARRSACGDTEAGFRTVIIGDVDLWSEKKRVNWRAVTGDGTRWLHNALDTTAARDIAYGAGYFVIVGPNGLLESSHDGQTWQAHPVSAPEEFQRIVWTGNRFVVSGGKQTWTSPDALTWKAESSRIPCGIAWARETTPLALGLSWGGNIHISTDFSAWKKVSIPSGPSLEAIAFAADR